jgi:hypothetical protein
MLVKLRTRHLVCMLLLLSALRAADGSILPSGQNGFDAHYLSALLSQDGTGFSPKVTLSDHRFNWGSGNGYFTATRRFDRNRGDDSQLGLPAGSLATYRTAWTMRPPAAQSVALHAVTGFGFRTPTPAPSL